LGGVDTADIRLNPIGWCGPADILLNPIGCNTAAVQTFIYILLAGVDTADIRLNPIWAGVGACRHSSQSYWLQYCRRSFKSYWLVWILQIFV
jgi:hypothetical protein